MTETLISNCGNAVANGSPFGSVFFRGWYRLQTSLASSTARVLVRSSTAVFSDIIIETISALSGDVNRLIIPFTVDLSATINTLAKLQSAQFVYTTTDANAGVSPATVTVDAASLEITGVV